MILVKRFSEPAIFKSTEITDLRLSAKVFFNKDASQTAQLKFKFSSRLLKSETILKCLLEMSSGKCFYCESFFDGMDFQVEHFRPISGSLGLSDGEFSPLHYWWLAYEWMNFTLSCNSCAQSKGNRFPVQGNRATPESNQDEVFKEQILILDPCGYEDPWKHLSFKENGEVVGISNVGKITIDVLGLNRSTLVEGRFVRIKSVHSTLVENIRNGLDLNLLEAKKLYASQKQEFSQCLSQLISVWFTNTSQYLGASFKLGASKKISLIIPRFKKLKTKSIPSSKTSFKRLELSKVPTKKRKKSLQDSISKLENKLIKNFLKQAHLVESLEIINFKSIDHVLLNFGGNFEDKAPWKMLIGENGVGKTSILQALSLALAGPEELLDLNLKPKKYIKNNHDKLKSVIKVTLTGQQVPVTLQIDMKGFNYLNPPPVMLMFGYGATRLLGDSEDFSVSRIYVKNLFNPRVSLDGVKTWLHEIDDDQFNSVARALRDVLQLGETGKFQRNKSQIFFSKNGTNRGLDELSDGYQSLIAICGHLIKRLLKYWPSLDVAEGIVLIDEIGLHMHPRWKMKIVNSLREAFPRVQFLCTTHDPLCLRGLQNNEVEVVERDLDSDIIFLRNDLPPLEGMRIDQILMSEHFGLHSTQDPQTEQLYQEYYQLLRSGDVDKKERILLLKRKIDEMTVLGTTRRERMALELIDSYISSIEKSIPDANDVKFRDSTKTLVFEILSGQRDLNEEG